MGHTPGPWTIISGGSANALAMFPRSEDGEANARLIAAAPELLAALKALDDYWTPSFPEGPGEESEPSDAFLSAVKARLSDDTLAVWRQVRAAIAKATQP